MGGVLLRDSSDNRRLHVCQGAALLVRVWEGIKIIAPTLSVTCMKDNRRITPRPLRTFSPLTRDLEPADIGVCPLLAVAGNNTPPPIPFEPGAA